MRVHPIASTLLVFLFSISSLAAAEGPQTLAQPLSQLDLASGDSIVLLGDSITHQCLYTQYVEDYFYTRFPNRRVRIHNAGVGGAVAWDALQRFDKDIAAYKPKYVTILLGMNDGHYRPYDDEVFQTYRRDMTELITRIKAIGATPILITPTMFDARARRIRQPENDADSIRLYNSVLTYYGTWLRDVAVQQGFGFVDMWGPLNNITLKQRKTDAKFTMIPDAVHPGPAGQVVMATAIVQDLDLPRKVSSIRIATRAKGKRRVQTTGGKLSDLEITDAGVEFTWLADSLPWVVPEEAQLGAKLARLGMRLSRETLTIGGLAPGRYEVTVDGTSIGRYSTALLGGRLGLHGNSKTPQYQQALAVAQLNKQRNSGPVRALRGQWGQFQRYARSRRAAEAQPDNEELQKQLAANQAKIEGMAERVAQFNRAAKAMEDKIFEINQPQPRHYVVRRVAATRGQ